MGDNGILEADFDDAAAVLALAAAYRKRLRTTNGVERINNDALDGETWRRSAYRFATSATEQKRTQSFMRA